MTARAVQLASSVCLAVAAVAAPLAPGEREIPPDAPRATQRLIVSSPPSPPAATPVDPGASLPPLPPVGEASLELLRLPESLTPAQPPNEFNPDPGASLRPAPIAGTPFYKFQEPAAPRSVDLQPVPADRALPRSPLERAQLEFVWPTPPPSHESEPLPAGLALPRDDVRENRFIPVTWQAPESYPLAAAGQGYPANTTPVPDRWRSTGFVPWHRYATGDPDESPYAQVTPERWHYYRQSILKGDLPFRGQDIFLSLAASAAMVFEDRQFTGPGSSNAAPAGGFDVYHESHSQTLTTSTAFRVDLFKGETVFKPVEWRLHVKPVINVNRVSLRESGLRLPAAGSAPNSTQTAASVSRQSTRTQDFISLQELSYEKHLADLSANYDFCAIRIGNQTFNTDFRGLIFNDTNFGVRFFGSYDNNRWQYNAAVFDLREKDAASELNTFHRRGQVVLVANVYRQDFWKKGYTAEFSVHASFDQSSTHSDNAGVLLRPAPLGVARPHSVNSYYLGWAGDGHLGRWNLSHAAYIVLGRDAFNGLAGQPANIFAQLAALELSYDRDWLRLKGSLFYASGDRHPTDDRATGFDSILDNSNFTGGPFSYYARQGFNLGGTAVGLKQRFSMLPDLRTSKSGGQQNFVNPGLFLAGLGAETDVTPRVRAFLNTNLIRFVTTAPIEAALPGVQVDNAFGVDLSLGVRWRPLLTENIVVTGGFGTLLPARGLQDIFRATQSPVPKLSSTGGGPAVDRYLRSVVLSVALTY